MVLLFFCIEPISLSGDNIDIESTLHRCLNRLLLVHCTSSSQFLMTLCSLDTLLAARPSLRLLIIDSIDSFRDLDRFGKTESNFAEAMTSLDKLVRTHRLVAIATRRLCHVTRCEKRDSAGKKKMRSCNDDNEYLNPWRHLVTERRIFAKRRPSDVDSDDVIYEISSPNDRNQLLFTISDTGICYKHCQDLLSAV